MARITVVVTTHEWPEALALVLQGLSGQRDADFQLIVADDGSGTSTARVIQDRRASFAEPILHVHQPHRGFRAASIRNAAIRAASGEYMVFLDGDSIPGPGFVAAHRAAARAGRAMRGRRTLLSPGLTARCLEGREHPWRVGLGTWLRWKLSGDVSRLRPLLCLDVAPPVTRTGISWRRVHTVNFAAWKSDLVRVNGFDETFVGWGLEDSDLVVRLGVAGVRTFGLGPAASVFHLHHPPARASVESVRERTLLIESRLRDGVLRCAVGLDRNDADAIARPVGPESGRMSAETTGGLENHPVTATVPPHAVA